MSSPALISSFRNPMLLQLEMTRSKMNVTRVFAAILGAIFLPISPLAAAGIWDGGGGADTNWETAANWDNNLVPASSYSTTITLGLSTATAPVVDSNDPWLLRSLTFIDNGSVNLTGNTLAFAGFGTGTSLGGAAGSGIRTISNDIYATSSDTTNRFTISNFLGSGLLTLNGNLTVDLTGTGVFLIRGAAHTTVNGVISGSSGASTVLVKTDVGILNLNNSANKISTFTIMGGSAVLGANNGLGDGVAFLMGNSSVVSGGINLNLNGYNQTLGSVTTLANNVSNTLRIFNSTGTTSVLTYSRNGSDETLTTIQLGNTGTNLSLVKAGTNTLTLNTTNTYTGLTDVQAGTLRYGANNQIASGAVQVSGGTLDLVTFSDTVGTVTLQSGSITSTTGVLTGTSYAVESGSIGAILGGSGTLTKSTAGTVTLTGVNTYTGTSTISAGTLIVSGTGSINGSSAVTVNGGTLNYSSSTNLTSTLTFTSGTLAGTNFAGKTLSIGASQTISPGNSTGTLTSAAETWASGGTYAWEINDATGAAGGNGWDLLSINGALTISATSGSKFNLNVISLAAQVAGQAANFNSLIDGAWLIADATSAITTFDASAFNLNLAGFQNTYNGVWTVALGGTGAFGGDSSQIYLTYSAIPEPSAALLFAGSLLAFVIMRRRSARRGMA